MLRTTFEQIYNRFKGKITDVGEALGYYLDIIEIIT